MFTQLLYREHPYGHLPIGTEDALRGADCSTTSWRFHRRVYTPAHATVIAVGDASHDRLAALVERAFGGWTTPRRRKRRCSSTWPRSRSAADAGRGSRRCTAPGAAQSELRIGHVGLPRSTPDYHALLVMNMMLGGQFVSRINMNLREEKGYTYGARTSFEFRKGPGPFVFQTSVQSDVTADAVRESLGEIEGIRGERPVTAAELELGRAALTRGYPRNFETAEQLGRAAVQLALYGLPDDYFTTFVPRVLAVERSRRHARGAGSPRPRPPADGDRRRPRESRPDARGLNLGERSEVAIA